MTHISDTAVSPANAYDRIRPVARQRKPAVSNALSSEERKKLLSARNYVEKETRRIARDIAAGKIGRANRRKKALNRTRSMTIVAAAYARKTTKCWGDKPSLSDLVAEIDSGKSFPAKVRRIEKSKGGHRSIISYDMTDKARQIAVARSYGAAMTYHPRQFGVKGKGILHAVKVISELIKTGEYTHVQELDIKDCFGSVRAENLATILGIPEEIVREIITTQGKETRGQIRHFQGIPSTDSTGTYTGHCLPQGASSSPLFAYAMLADVLEEFERLHGTEVAIINFCDNFLLLGRSKVAVGEGAKTLIRMLAEHPAGQFVLARKTGIRALSRGIDFVGYRFAAQPGKPIVRAPADKLKGFKLTFARIVAEIKRPTGRGITTTESKISAAARFALRHLSKFRYAPEDHFELCWAIMLALEPYKTNADVARLFAHIDRKAPEDGERRRNKLSGPEIANRPSRNRISSRSITSQMLTVPRNFSASRVVVDLAGRPARAVFVLKVIMRLKAGGMLKPTEAGQ